MLPIGDRPGVSRRNYPARGGAVAVSVLLVESHADTRELYEEYLTFAGFRVETAATTDEAIARARAADVIVTGLSVRGSVDGLGLVSRLRQDVAHGGTPIIVLTAWPLASHRARALAAGADRFLAKPCLPDTLLAHVRELIGKRPRVNPS